VPSQQPDGQLHKQHNIQTKITMDKKQHNKQTKITMDNKQDNNKTNTTKQTNKQTITYLDN
jgi:hypothetical protein